MHLNANSLYATQPKSLKTRQKECYTQTRGKRETGNKTKTVQRLFKNYSRASHALHAPKNSNRLYCRAHDAHPRADMCAIVVWLHQRNSKTLKTHENYINWNGLLQRVNVQDNPQRIIKHTHTCVLKIFFFSSLCYYLSAIAQWIWKVELYGRDAS